MEASIHRSALVKKRLFELLKSAYIDSRYNKEFVIYTRRAGVAWQKGGQTPENDGEHL